MDLFISAKGKPFVPAKFNTISGLDRREYHVADVSYDRIFMSVCHKEVLVNLYVSKKITKEEVTFGLSLENIMTFFPNITWKDSWLE